MSVDLATLPRRRPLGAPRPVPASRAAAASRRRPVEGTVLFLLCAAGYLSVAGWMLSERVIFADGVSRVANGYFVLFSRDPHLPAVGFVWNPLPSLLLLPVLPFGHLFRPLTRDGFAGAIESALFMAGTVVLLASCLRRLGVGRAVRLVLVALFALHPMIITYAGSGESEAMLLFFLLLTVSALIGWLQDQRPGQLVTTGLGLGLAYFTRYEAVAPAATVTVLVAGLTLLRGGGNWSQRAHLAVNDAMLVALPFVFASAVWSVSARVLVGQWFPTLSSRYGNSAQVSGSRSFIEQATGNSTLAALHYAADQITGLAPLVLPLLVVAAVVATRRRDGSALSALVVLGSVVAFDNLAFLTGSSFGWLRFQIAVIPLAVLLAATILRPATPTPAHNPTQPKCGARPRNPSVLAAVVVLLAVACALPVSFRTLGDHRLAREETATMLAALVPSHATSADRRHLRIFQTERQVADQLDAMHLPEGSVLTDSAFAFPVLLATKHPEQFVITSDRDFISTLADPAGHHVRYLLVPEPAKAPSDALERALPGLYENGAGIATQVSQWKGTSFNGDWRLLQVR